MPPEARSSPATGDAASDPLTFWSRSGDRAAKPVEWSPGYAELPTSSADVDVARAWCQGQELTVVRRRLAGEVRTLAEWPRLGPGRYRIRYQVGEVAGRRVVAIRPAKISEDAFRTMLEELESRLPVSIVLRIRAMGGLSGLDDPRTDANTIDQELQILRRAVEGTDARPGLAAILPRLARDHHDMLVARDRWVRRERARRPAPQRLRDALTRGQNIDFDPGGDAPPLPKRVVDARVRHTADLYENRLVASYWREVDLRLRRLRPVLEHTRRADVRELAERLARKLAGARRAASFLDGVRFLELPPTRLTMVLLKRPAYRAALSGYQELHRSVRVAHNDPRLEAPLRNLPTLYQLWCTLVSLDVLADVAEEEGYQLGGQRLVRRFRRSAFFRVLPDGKPALRLVHPERGVGVRAIPERSYPPGGTPYGSHSHTQRPDLAIEIEGAEGSRRLFVLDPKYKLWSEDSSEGDGRPKKIDIDRMHAYRDAIRDPGGEHVVRFAGILYPGATVAYPTGIAAFRAVPGSEAELREALGALFQRALSGS